jgi:hypothetical protein
VIRGKQFCAILGRDRLAMDVAFLCAFDGEGRVALDVPAQLVMADEVMED